METPLSGFRPPVAPVEDGEAEHRTLRLAWYGLSVLLMTTLFAFVVRQMLSLIAPSLQAELGFTDTQIGLLQGLGLAVFASLASYPMGWLADRFGRAIVLALGVGCWSLATLLCAFQSTFGGLLAGAIGIAIGEAGLAPIVYAMIPDLFPERRRHAANLIFYGGSLLGAGLGMMLGGALLGWLAASRTDLPAALAGVDTWRLAMIAVALPGPLFLLLVATMPGAARGRRDAPTRAARRPSAEFLPYARAHAATLACIFGSIFAMGIAMTSALVWFPLALPRAFGVTAASVGVGLGSAITIATLVGVAMPALLLKARRRSADDEPIAVARIFVALTPLPAAALFFVASPAQAYAVAAVQGALGVAGSALMPGVLQSLAPAGLRSRVLALLGITNALALAGSPIAVGLISDLLPGPRGMLQAISLVSAPALVASALLISLAARPYSTTVRSVRAQALGDPA